MVSGKQCLLAILLFPTFLWLLISVLEPVAALGWLGPVPARNLEDRFDAGALFYTEVNMEELRAPEAARAGDFLKDKR